MPVRDDRVADAGPDMEIPSAALGELIEKAAMSAGAIGIPGALSFGFDVTAISAIWVTMTVSIARRLGHEEPSKELVTKLVAAVLKGAGMYIVGSKAATQFFHFIPVGGTLTVIGVNSSLNYLFTRRLGYALVQLFSKSRLDADDLSGAVAHCLLIVKQFPKGSEVAAIVDALRPA